MLIHPRKSLDRQFVTEQMNLMVRRNDETARACSDIRGQDTTPNRCDARRTQHDVPEVMEPELLFGVPTEFSALASNVTVSSKKCSRTQSAR